MYRPSWDEYCDKVGKPEEQVGSYSIGTYQGKPAVDHTAAGVDDDAMGGDPFAEPSAASQGPVIAAGKGKPD